MRPGRECHAVPPLEGSHIIPNADEGIGDSRKVLWPAGALINENDSVAVEELMFTDNDELSGLIAAQLNAEKLIILTTVGGVFSGRTVKRAARDGVVPRSLTITH